MGKKINRGVWVLLLSAAYLFIALTHILVIRQSAVDQNKLPDRYYSIFRGPGDDSHATRLPLMKRPDKTTPEENKDVIQWITNHALSFFVSFFNKNIPKQDNFANYAPMKRFPRLSFSGCLRC